MTTTTVPLGNRLDRIATWLHRLPERTRLRILRLRVRIRQLLAVSKTAPWHVRVVVIIALIYPISPIKIVMEFVPVLGQIDEVLVIAGAALWAKRFHPATARALRNLLK